MGAGVAKQYLPLLGAPLLSHTLQNIFAWPRVAGVVVALAAEDTDFARLPEARHPLLHHVIGGAERAHSVVAALDYLRARALPEDTPVLVHDAVRPCVAPEDIAALMQPAVAPMALLAQPANDTVKMACRQKAVVKVAQTLPRADIWLAQTPQRAPLQPLHRALTDAIDSGAEITDEASALEWAGFAPELICGRSDNIKITRPADLLLAEALLRLRGTSAAIDHNSGSFC